MKLTATKSGIRVIPKVKRESFLPADEKWLATHSEVQLGKFIGEGTQGSVYTVKGRPSLVVKIPAGYNNVKSEDELNFNQRARRWNLYKEIKDVEKFGSEPLIIPSKAVTIKNKHGFEVPGIVRPRVKTIIDYTKRYTNKYPSGLSDLTDVEIEQVRQKVIALSKKGILLKDGLQVGRDRRGRIQLYDVGGIIQDGDTAKDIRYTFDFNQGHWENFLYLVGRLGDDDGYDEVFKKYGMIKMVSR